MPSIASIVYCILGRAYDSLGDFSKAIKYHEQGLAIAKEVGDRAAEGRAYANLGNAYQSQGDFSKAVEKHGQHLAIAKEVSDRAAEGGAYGNLGIGEGGAYANLGIAYRGTMRRPSSTTRSAWRLQRRWATGRWRAGRTQPRHLPHALERVHQSRGLLRSTTCYGNIAEACTRAIRRSAQHGCRPHPWRPRRPYY
jgi:tetratricopeptide (TPR) repeat protein